MLSALVSAETIAARQQIIVSSRSLSGKIEIYKLDGENVADDEVVRHIVVQGDIAGTDKIQDSLLAHHLFGADEKFDDDEFTDIIGQNQLHLSLIHI